MDLNKRGTHDYVDNPFFSIFQIRVRYLLHQIYIDQNYAKLSKQEDEAKLTPEELAWRQKVLPKESSAEQRQEYHKKILLEQGARIGDTDIGKVTLLVNLTFNERHRKKTEKELKRLKYLAEKYGADEFTVLNQFAYDVQEVEKMTNKEIAHSLNKLGYINDQG